MDGSCGKTDILLKKMGLLFRRPLPVIIPKMKNLK